MNPIKLAREFMQERVQINGAPSELLIELAVEKGIELSKKYKVNSDIVSVSLYLAHAVFSPEWGSDIQKNHPQLSSVFIKPYLIDWNITQENQGIITHAIETHHTTTSTGSLVAEVMKNAECFKFVSLEGAVIWFHELALRGVPYNEARQKVIKKMEQKLELLTLEDCIIEAEKNCKYIRRIFT